MGVNSGDTALGGSVAVTITAEDERTSIELQTRRCVDTCQTRMALDDQILIRQGLF